MVVIIPKTVYGGRVEGTGGYGEKDKAPRVITCVWDAPIWEDTAWKASAEIYGNSRGRKPGGGGQDTAQMISHRSWHS